ncbi:hypothetical protein BaRGS_00030471, partial [Batillaria attramentaria]
TRIERSRDSCLIQLSCREHTRAAEGKGGLGWLSDTAELSRTHSQAVFCLASSRAFRLMRKWQGKAVGA